MLRSGTTMITNKEAISKNWEIVTHNWALQVPYIPEKKTLGAFPVQIVRRDFPILSEKINGKPLIWLDNAATTQKPACVIQRLDHFYRHENSNVHRGAHTLAARATDAFEAARETVSRFLHATSPNEIIFVRGTTEAVNLIARTYGKQNIHEGDEILVSQLEHHANIVPWQLLCRETGANLRVIPVDDTGQLILSEYEKLLGIKTKLVSLCHVSNALGTIAPIGNIIDMAHAAGAKVLIDGAQAVSHLPVDVVKLDCDFYAFSGHKLYGPTGIGALYIKKEIMNDLPPYQGGGNMISDVTFEETRYQAGPARFEAGTGNIADAAGLAAAIDYVSGIGLDQIFFYEHKLLEYATDSMQHVPGLSMIGTAAEKTSILSFVLKDIANETVGKVLNEYGIAVRAGHHCAQPILRRFGLEGTVRPSLAFYNTTDEIDEMVRVLKKLRKD